MQTNNSLQLQIAICDDEEIDCEEIVRVTREILRNENIEATLTAYKSSQALLEAVEQQQKFDIFLLDVMLDDMSGIELAAHLRKHGDHTAIIFISNNRDMALQGYKVSAVRYLAKPLSREYLQEALMYCYRILLSKKEIPLPTTKGKCRVSASEIQYIEVCGRGTKIWIQQEQIDCRLNISTLESIFTPHPHNFMRCHQGFLVNLAFVRFVRKKELELKSGTVIPISKYRYKETLDHFMDYLEE